MHVDIDEALRYAGVRSPAPVDLRRSMEAVASEVQKKITPRWHWRLYDIEHRTKEEYLPAINLSLTGHSAKKMLAECDRTVLLCCTLGTVFDSYLRSLQSRDMTKALLTDAYGNALVEAGCDAAEKEIAGRLPDCFLTDRFSPGYGDLPLALQPQLCQALQTEYRLGVYVTDSLLMNPCKSVTAVIGLSRQPQKARIRGCAYCSMKDTCQIRKGGKTCGSF